MRQRWRRLLASVELPYNPLLSTSRALGVRLRWGSVSLPVLWSQMEPALGSRLSALTRDPKARQNQRPQLSPRSCPARFRYGHARQRNTNSWPLVFNRLSAILHTLHLAIAPTQLSIPDRHLTIKQLIDSPPPPTSILLWAQKSTFMAL